MPMGSGDVIRNNLQVVLDLIVDVDSKQAVGPFPAFGRIGDFRNPDTVVPFTLMKDGLMDRGSNARPGPKEQTLLIRGARLGVGENISMIVGGNTSSYEIVSLVSLLDRVH